MHLDRVKIEIITCYEQKLINFIFYSKKDRQ